jgi:hypothetical protein
MAGRDGRVFCGGRRRRTACWAGPTLSSPVGLVASIVLGYAYVAIVAVIRRFVMLTEN